MTYEEAKRILNPDGDNVWRGAAEVGGVETVAEACRVAVTAIEKQIPKRFELFNGQCSCPNCKALFGPDDVRKRLIHWDMPFCKFCGQALIWDDAGGAGE